MRLRVRGPLLTSVLLWLGVQAGMSCSTTEVIPAPPPASAEVPVYISAPHPEGYSLGDLQAVMVLKEAPAPGFAKTCDEAFVKLSTLTQSVDELQAGARELVKQEPLHFHWCFYSKVSAMHEELRGDRFIDQKQKLVLETFSFLVPVARAFMSEFRDSRYLRWAVKDYRQVSEWVFFRRLELTPQLTSELVDVTNPFGAWKDSTATTKNSVKDKYGLTISSPYTGGGAGLPSQAGAGVGAGAANEFTAQPDALRPPVVPAPPAADDTQPSSAGRLPATTPEN